LGDEAVFLGSRRNDVGGDPNQAYEVTFAVMDGALADKTTVGRSTLDRSTVDRAAVARAAMDRAAADRAAVDTAEAGRRAAALYEAHRAAQRVADRKAEPDASQPPLRRAAQPAQAAAAGAAAGVFVSWKKFLRHVSLRDASALPDSAAEQPGARGPLRDRAVARDSQTEVDADGEQDSAQDSASNGGRGGASNGAFNNGSNGTLNSVPPGGSRAGSNGRPGRGGAAMPHWLEFVPGEMRRPGDPSDQALLADASRVAAARPAQNKPGSAQPAAGQRTANSSRTAPTSRTANTLRAVSPPSAAEVYSLEKLGAELEELRRMFERQGSGRAPLVLPSRELLSDTRLAQYYHRLSDNSVEPSLASELVARLQPAANEGADGRRLGALLAEAVRSRFKTNSDLGRPGAAVAAVALVGPSGAGKTTAVAKLAFRCGVLRRRRVRLFSVDPLRMGAVESLQAYAELMNLPLKVIDDFDALGPALGAGEEDGEPELLLIDTPGYGRREWERARRLAAVFRERGDVDVHLVVDLRTKSEDLCRAVENFRIFRPAKLLFTRLDETTSFGTMLNETVRTGLPVSFVSVGQRVPEDIVPAGEPELLRLLLKNS
jgi:flagellar biosynthesis protein FlhF